MNTVFFTLAILGLPGGGEWIIIALVILVLFGGRKIPELMKGLGSGIKEFKKASKEDSSIENNKDQEIKD
ncbi:MAG: twin-arginine translocase TatA/TatE family subunit [Flavobacteriales bacterium]|jgi:sec-independent protein translocase protein TatA|nr:twin-arginine translocase TatA/TatE family subunit [Flavobacteriales bacterium]|tara:strand:+ start:894 stop:1103 length:210 start_codon:yes stop_codon:yes gene_type:complete